MHAERAQNHSKVRTLLAELQIKEARHAEELAAILLEVAAAKVRALLAGHHPHLLQHLVPC